MAHLVNNLPAMWKTWVHSLGWITVILFLFFLSFDRELKISLVVSSFLQIGNDYVQQATFSQRQAA